MSDASPQKIVSMDKRKAAALPPAGAASADAAKRARASGDWAAEARAEAAAQEAKWPRAHAPPLNPAAATLGAPPERLRAKITPRKISLFFFVFVFVPQFFDNRNISSRARPRAEFMQMDCDYTVEREPLPGMPGSAVGPVPVLRLYGVDRGGHSVFVHVHGCARAPAGRRLCAPAPPTTATHRTAATGPALRRTFTCARRRAFRRRSAARSSARSTS